MGLALIAAILFGVAAAPASAETIVVTTASDFNEDGGCVNVEAPCTLRDAIGRANELQGPDTIHFGQAGFISSGTIFLTAGELPAIESATTIDATAMTGYAGAPLVEINGEVAHESVGWEGFEVLGGPTRIEGLAIGGFENGILVESPEPTQICADRIGTDPDGLEAFPNLAGVLVANDSIGARIGSGCPEQEIGENGDRALVPNVISGNDLHGVIDSGAETTIAANDIGLDANGGALPNGTFGSALGDLTAGGVYAAPESRGLLVGPEAQDVGNAIAFNKGSGVFIAEAAQRPTIASNEIYENSGLGIAFEGARKPPVPVLDAVFEEGVGITAEGALSGKAGETYALDFYANPACDDGGAGEGKTPIGGGIVETDSAGVADFSVTGLEPLPLGQQIVTATATPQGDGPTSEFSTCRALGPAPPPPVQAPKAGVENRTALIPDNGETIVVEPSSGQILIKRPNEKKFRPLKEGEKIPVGSVVDATKGRVVLTSIDSNGSTQTATFFGGVFKVAQRDGNKLVVLKLVGGDFSGCPKRGSATASGKKGRKLWGSGKGSFRTEGSHGSATVRGTIWLVEDRCGGTFFKTRRGVVTVRDFDAGKTVQLPAGKTYLAD